MAAARGIDEHDVDGFRGRVGDGVFGNVGCVFAVAALVELDAAAGFAVGEFAEVARVDAQLLDGARPEGVAGGDEEGEVVLQEEEGEFAKVGRFTHAVDADNGDHVWAFLLGVDGRDRAEDVEGGGGGEDFVKGGGHGGAEGGIDGFEGSGFGVDQVALDTFAKADRGLASDIFVEKVRFHSFEGFVQLCFCEGLAANYVAEKARDGPEAGIDDSVFWSC